MSSLPLASAGLMPTGFGKSAVGKLAAIAVLLGVLLVCVPLGAETSPGDPPLQLMPPHPDLIARMAARGYDSVTVVRLRRLAELRRRKGIDQPRPIEAPVTGTRPAIVLLVEFSDLTHNATSTSSLYSNLLFSVGTYPSPGSMRDYLREASYGLYDMSPGAVDGGWRKTSNAHTYYADADGILGTDDDYGFGAYPQNAQGLVVHAVGLADPYVNFASYATGGEVQGLFVVHAGRGAETDYSRSDWIWSHQWGLGAHAVTADGVTVDDYTMVPEYVWSPGDTTIGVFCHEYGHLLGLPDLYDYDDSSAGLGNWSLMAFGSWNGTDGSSPAHPDAYSRAQLGWVTPQVVSGTITGASLAAVESNAVVYRLWTSGAAGSEYFLLENRQRTGFDQALPGSGLLLYHVDESADQMDDWHPLVMLEQADGQWDLQYYSNYGDGGDPYPGTSGKREVTDATNPDTTSYAGADSQVRITSISDSGPTMTANLTVVSAVGEPHFTEIGAAMNLPTAIGAAWGDYDDDGDADLFTGGMWGVHRCLLWRNNGDGTFTDVTVAMGLRTASSDWEDWGAAWGDFNNDGRLDLVVTGGNHPIFLYRNDGDHFTDVGGPAAGLTYYATSRGVAWGDYDRDNWLDLYVCYELSNVSRLYRNNRDGTFTEVTNDAGMEFSPAGLAQSCGWADYNNDGLGDLAVARLWWGGYGNPPRLYKNKGDGTFADMSAAGGFLDVDNTTGVAWGDYDNDGYADLYLTTGHARPQWLFHNDADGTFTNAIYTAGLGGYQAASCGAAWADYDNDGYLDLAVANAGNGGAPFLHRNDRDGTFTEVSASEGLTSVRKYRAAVWADLDLDGHLDLFAAANDNYSCLYHNEGAPTDGNWLRVGTLTDADGDATDPTTSDDRDALGARVEVNLDNNTQFPPGRTLLRVIDGGSSYMGQNEPIAHFGLGSASTVAVRVAFPDGSIVIQGGISAGQQITVRDPGQGLGWIQGTVKDAITGNPIVGAEVSCLYFTSITKAGGVYRLADTPTGSIPTGLTLTVTASAADYQSGTVTGVTVADGVGTTVNFDLVPEMGSISGIVRDSLTQTPIAGATVTCGVWETVTGADGRYLFSDVPVGTYNVSASAAGYQTSTLTGVAVLGGQTSIVDFALVLATGAIAGTVRDALTSAPIGGAIVTWGTSSTTTGAEGTYLFSDVPVGSGHSVSAGKVGYQTSTVTGVTVVGGQTTTVNFSLLLVPGAIGGTVRDAGTQAPVAGATVTCGALSATSGGDGTYLISAVPVGAGYTVTASAAGYVEKSATGISVGSGLTTTVNFALSPRLGAIAGRVRDATTWLPIAGATVQCGSLSDATDAKGRYRLPEVRIGTGYTVTASATGYGGGSVSDVTVYEGQTTTVDLVLTASAVGTITGVVSDASTGWAIVGATVSCGAVLARTGSSGAYTLSGIPVGSGYRVGASAGGYQWARATDVSVTAGQTTTRSFQLTPLPALAGPQFQEMASLPGLTNGIGLGWGDYDGDGYADLFVGGEKQGVEVPGRPPHGPLLFHNNQNLTFTDVTESMNLSSTAIEQDGVAWGDYDNDGDLDILVGSGGGYPLLYRHDPTGFSEVGQNAGFRVSFSAGRGTAWCDFNADNLLDAFCSNIFGPGYLMRNNGNGTFTEVSAAAGMVGEASNDSAQSASWGDYDNDGWPDLAVARLAKATKLFRNNGDGTFTDVSVSSGVSAAVDAYSAVWGDYDNDGWLDLYATSANYVEPQLRPDWLFRNNGDGTFTEVSGSVGMAADHSIGSGASWGDYDNDGYLDLFVGNYGSVSFLYHNDGDGSFTDLIGASGLAVNDHSAEAAWADIDLDGRLDLGQMFYDAPVRLFRNANLALNWLRVRALTSGNGDATGGDPPRDAVGARVELNVDDDDNFLPGRTLTRSIDGGSGFCGQNEQVAQFGIPTSGPVAVRVLFPDGSVVVHRGVSLRQTVVILDVPADREELFDDIPLDHWAYGFIRAVAEAGIAAGYPDLTYRPTLPVTRDQMAVYVSRALAGGDSEVPAFTGTPTFSDVGSGHWALKYVEYAQDEGIVGGYPDGTYRPTAALDRGQMAAFIARAMAGGDDAVPDGPPTASFPDVAGSFWAYKYIEYIRSEGVTAGYPDECYHPEYACTRDQMAVYVARAFGLPV